MIAETAATPREGGKTEILAALRTASAKTGSDFDYLLATAKRESSLDSSAKTKSSSATGLFQFIDQTWLGLVKRYGEAEARAPLCLRRLRPSSGTATRPRARRAGIQRSSPGP